MKTNFLNELEPELQSKLYLLKEVPPRDALVKARQRAQYLAQLEYLPASKNSVGLLASWPFSVFGKSQTRKSGGNVPNWQMSFGKAFATIGLVLILVFGSLGVTAYAAQDSLPSSAIYPVKILTEDLRLRLTTDVGTKFDLILAYANKRVEEITALQTQGIPVEEPVVTRLQDQYEFALQLASGMPDDQMAESLEQLQESAQVQIMTMAALRENAPSAAGGQIQQVQEVLQEQQTMVQSGLSDPETFRENIRKKSKHNAGGNDNGVGANDEPGPSDQPAGNEPKESPGGKGPGHDQKEPDPPAQPPAGDEDKGKDEKGNGPGSANEDSPGNGSGQSNPVDEDEEVIFSVNRGLFAQYGIILTRESQRGNRSKFNGSPIFVP